MARKNKLKFCVIGCGNISLKYFIDALKISDKSDIVVCVDHTDRKRQLVKERFELPLETDFDYTLNNYDFDAVYLATPTGLHKEYAITAAQNGKHILCEKSLASNFTDAEEMINSAKNNAVAIFEGFMYQFHNQNIYVSKLLKKGLIGEVNLVNAWFGFPPRGKYDFRLNKQKGGGGLLDAAAYPLHFARNIFKSEPTKVDANIKTENGIDISGIINLTFSENRNAQLAFSMNTFYKNKYELWGNKGNIRVERAFSVAPEYIPIINLESSKGSEIITLEPDNHFVKEINFFVENCNSTEKQNEWYKEALSQSQLLDSILQKVK